MPSVDRVRRVAVGVFVCATAAIAPASLGSGVAVATVGTASAVAPAAPVSLQVVTVRAASSSATTARLDLWARNVNGTYRHVWGPAFAHIGSSGVGRTREGLSRTPAGVFGLTHAFGNQANNATKLPYFRAGTRDWWNENPRSAKYNSHVVQRSSPGGASENLYYTGRAYAHAIVIDYNMHPVVNGAGSGFFLHVSTGHATAGCVSVSSSKLDTVMRWLTPARRPRISIGVGSAALRVLGTTATPPAWPTGHAPFRLGNTSAAVGTWQRQLHRRGASALMGSGHYGSNSVSATERLQRLAGLPVTGMLDRRTWPLAWTGRY